MIKKTGLLATTTEKFRLRPLAKWTMGTFKSEFQLGNKERIRRLTAGDARFNTAFTATTPPTNNATTPPATPAIAAGITPATAVPPVARHVSVEWGKIYYCWTHGLSAQHNHTSISCLNKAEGYRDDATVFRMYCGCDTISSGRASGCSSARRRLPYSPSPATSRGCTSSPGN